MRTGLHSGEVVVGSIGDDLRMDYTAQGHTVGLASRMQDLASPDTCYLTADTAALVKGYFELEDLGAFQVKGVDGKVPVFELRDVGRVRTRFDVSRSRGLTRLIGREDDAAFLERALEQAQAGDGQVVGVVAEAGVGKSRLCFEFLESCRARGFRTHEGRAVAHGRNVPLLPILQAFRSYFEIGEGDDARRVREKIAGRLLLLNEEHREALPMVFDFFGVPDPQRPAPAMDPEARQRALFRVLRRSVHTRDVDGPVVTLIEDLHWLDGASEAWLAEWVSALAGSSNLLVVNFRPEYRAAWMQQPWYRALPLKPLGREAIRELLEDLIGDRNIVDALIDPIFARTAGNPFFAEEVVLGLFESGHLEGRRGSYRLVASLDRIEVPDNVHALLAARIDHLAEGDKRVLQTAAVLGKVFEERILSVVSEIDSAELAPALQRLKAADFLYEESLYPDVLYAFKHPLTQEVALTTQLRQRRREVHALAARALTEARSDELDESAGLIAHHWEQAGESIEAARWHERAGRFVGKSDFVEARRHFEKVRRLVREAPDAPAAPELGAAACRQVLVLSYRLGISSEEQQHVFDDGVEWAHHTEDSFHEAQLHQAHSVVAVGNGRYMQALEHARAWQRIVSALPDAERRSIQYWPFLSPLLYLGDLSEVHSRSAPQVEATAGHPEWGIAEWGCSAFGDAVTILALTEGYRGDLSGAMSKVQHAVDMAPDLGDVEGEVYYTSRLIELAVLAERRSQAEAAIHRAVELAERAGSAIARSWGQLYFGLFLLSGEEPEAALEAFDRCDAGSFPFMRGRELVWRSEASLLLGDEERALSEAREAVDFTSEIGARIDAIYASLALSRALRATGADSSAIAATLDQAAAAIAATGARVFETAVQAERSSIESC